MYKIFLSSRDKNINAIDFYISIIEESIARSGCESRRIHRVMDIAKEDIVITLDAHSFFTVWKNNKKQKIANWFQGVAPEEIYFRNHNIKGALKMHLWNIFEEITLKHSYLNFFVSEEMLRHYKKKYRYDKSNYVIMPCFNQSIHTECFVQEKYRHSSFIYTGSLLKWQCFDETLDLFIMIKKKIPQATLTIITGDVNKARNVIKERGVENVEVKSIPYTKLSEELSNYKYGFLIRQDILLNNVATPTKMSSYLACGVIPVFSTVIKAFEENISNLKYVVRDNGDWENVVDQIEIIEKESVMSDDVMKEFSAVFDSFYNRERYIEKIKSQL